MRSTILIVLALLLVSPVARATPDETRSAARRLFLSGSKHLDLREYTDALQDF